MISIIIPFFNEEKILPQSCADLEKLSGDAELIFVDGASTDRSVQVAGRYGKVVCSKRGRASQMNEGARQAKGDVLLFLHADNVISAQTLSRIEKKIFEDGCIGGCCTQRIDNKALVYRFIEWQGNARARLTREFYGDQGIFVRKDVFFEIGCFPEVPIMEDVLFTKKLRGCGKTSVLPDRILVSARRWEKKGVVKTALLYALISLLFVLKVPLNRIRRFYEDLR